MCRSLLLRRSIVAALRTSEISVVSALRPATRIRRWSEWGAKAASFESTTTFTNADTDLADVYRSHLVLRRKSLK